MKGEKGVQLQNNSAKTKKALRQNGRKKVYRLEHSNAAGYLFITPFLIGLFVLTVYPFFASLFYSFTDYDIFSPPNWIGIQNYIKMFTHDDKFWGSFWVTIKYAVVQVPLRLIVSLLVALLLVKKTKLTNVYRAIFYIPSLLGAGVAVAITWTRLFGVDGVINAILQKIGIDPVLWLKDTKTALGVLIILSVWQFGSQMIIFLAAIKDVPKSLLEAATIDGAGPVKSFFKVTLPMISPAFFFNLVNGIIVAMQSFNSAYLITEGGPLNSTLVYGLYQYRQAFEFNHMGYASAMAWFLMLFIVALTALVFRSSSGWVYYQDEM